MIDILANKTSFRRVPYQSGNYSIELDIKLSNHFNDVNFFLSGQGSVFFGFGSNSGHYFASGSSKVYFDATMPNTDLNYTFVISNTTFDVYKDSTLLIANLPKPTGICTRLINQNTPNAEGQFSLILRGDKPAFTISSGMTFPINSNYTDSLVVTNNSNIPFHLLSGTSDTVNFVTPINSFPLLVGANSSRTLNFSGFLSSVDNRQFSFILNTDFINTANVITLSGTFFSGSGYVINVPSPLSVTFGSFGDGLFIVNNTGTTPLKFTPVFSKIVTGININVPTYSGVPINNYFSGYFDTNSPFYFSDHISWSGGDFYIIERLQTGVNLVSVTGDTIGGVTSGYPVGTNSNISVGQCFTLPYDYHLTGVSVGLAVTGSGFVSSDLIYLTLYQGNGVTGSIIADSSQLDASTIPTGISSGQNYYFNFSQPQLLLANNSYSLAIRGSPTFIGNGTGTPSRQVLLLATTGDIWTAGSGFINGTGGFAFQNGDAVISIDWMPPLNTTRYKVNHKNGTQANFVTISTGIYDKYQGYLSFSFNNTSIEALPNTPVYFDMTYSGLVSGMNFVKLDLVGLGYSTIISGLTT
jgi:hypothetical protein